MYRNGVYCFPLEVLLPLLAMLPEDAIVCPNGTGSLSIMSSNWEFLAFIEPTQEKLVWSGELNARLREEPLPDPFG